VTDPVVHSINLIETVLDEPGYVQGLDDNHDGTLVDLEFNENGELIPTSTSIQNQIPMDDEQMPMDEDVYASQQDLVVGRRKNQSRKSGRFDPEITLTAQTFRDQDDDYIPNMRTNKQRRALKRKNLRNDFMRLCERAIGAPFGQTFGKSAVQVCSS
jgi:hypothetical protein